MSRILDKNFRYTPSHSTDIRKTFERIRRRDKANAEEVKQKVEPLQTPKRKVA